LERLKNARDAETQYLRERNELEVKKTKELADIETDKFKKMVDAIGTSTLLAIATSGPDMQVWTARIHSRIVYLTWYTKIELQNIAQSVKTLNLDINKCLCATL